MKVKLENDIMAPRAKKSKLTSDELDIFTTEERRRIIYDEIRLPRPQGSNIVYTAAEAVNVLETLIRQIKSLDQPWPERTLRILIKEKMVNEKRIPVKICRFNRILKAVENGGSPQLYWNSRGRPNILPFKKLRDEFDKHAKREGVAWTFKDTKDVLVEELKRKREKVGLYSSTVKPPCNRTISAYHSALLSVPDLVLCFCN